MVTWGGGWESMKRKVILKRRNGQSLRSLLGEWVINKENTCFYQCRFAEASSFRNSTSHVGQWNLGWQPWRVGSVREKHHPSGDGWMWSDILWP